MSLPYSGPTFAQTLRQMHKGLRGGGAILVVEGTTDRRSFVHVVKSNVRIVPAGGRAPALAAYDELAGELPNVLFVIDCDNGLEPRHKGRSDLIITTHRDLEADLIFEMNAFERVAIDALAHTIHDRIELDSKVESVLSDALNLATRLSMVRDAARELGLKVRFQPGGSKNARVVRPNDIQDRVSPLMWPVDDLQLASNYGQLTGWSASQISELMSELARIDSCVHRSPCCGSCSLSRFCNGHDVVQSLALTLTARSGVLYTSSEIERSLRLSLDRSAVGTWNVAQRAERWEHVRGCTVFSR